MDEFKPKQTNPYSIPAEPVRPATPAPQPEPELKFSAPAYSEPSQAVAPVAPDIPSIEVDSHPAFEPVPPVLPVQTEVSPATPAPVPEPAAPAPIQTEEISPSPVPQPTVAPAPTQTPATPVGPTQMTNKKPIPKPLIAVPLALLIISVITGGVVLYSRQVGSLKDQLSRSEEDVSRLKSSGIGSGDQGLSLLGDNSEGQVAGENTEAEIIEDYVYNAQVVIRDNQLLLESYVDVDATGEIESIWINYGSGKSSLVQQTEKTTEGFAEKKEGIVQAIAYADVNLFEAGSSYMYRTSVKAKNGKIYKSGYSVFTIPGDPEAQENSEAPAPSQSGL